MGSESEIPKATSHAYVVVVVLILVDGGEAVKTAPCEAETPVDGEESEAGNRAPFLATERGNGILTSYDCGVHIWNRPSRLKNPSLSWSWNHCQRSPMMTILLAQRVGLPNLELLPSYEHFPKQRLSST